MNKEQVLLPQIGNMGFIQSQETNFLSVQTSPKDRKRDIGDHKRSSKAWKRKDIGRNPVVILVAISPKIRTES